MSALADGRSSDGGQGFLLFGVRVTIDEGSFRKSASMNNLVQYDHQPPESNNEIAAGYASDGVVHPCGRSRERKRGVPWSEEEHRLFLLGLQLVGKGDWRGISRNYVKTRTPTQVASHAQKYFLRRNNHSRRRRRSSLFDITTDMVVCSATEDYIHQENSPQPPATRQNPCKNLEKIPLSTFPVAVTPLPAPPIPTDNPMESLTLGQPNRVCNSPKPNRSIPVLPIPPSSKLANLNLNKPTKPQPPSLSLNLSISSQSPSPSDAEPLSSDQPSPLAEHPSSPFQSMPATFNGSGGDNIISVA